MKAFSCSQVIFRHLKGSKFDDKYLRCPFLNKKNKIFGNWRRFKNPAIFSYQISAAFPFSKQFSRILLFMIWWHRNTAIWIFENALNKKSRYQNLLVQMNFIIAVNWSKTEKGKYLNKLWCIFYDFQTMWEPPWAILNFWNPSVLWNFLITPTFLTFKTKAHLPRKWNASG